MVQQADITFITQKELKGRNKMNIEEKLGQILKKLKKKDQTLNHWGVLNSP